MPRPYKKHRIEASYAPGSNFKITDNGLVLPRKPKPEDILYYVIYQPDGLELCRMILLSECKPAIDKFLAIEQDDNP